MQVNIFILCHNESILLPHTVKHYKKYLPNCKITIYDNESTDNSVEIAKALGCNVISWNNNTIDNIDDEIVANNKINEYKYLEIKNNCWKHILNGWIIMIDMDEFLCVNESDLMNETCKGTTILDVLGLDMIGESKTNDLSDIDLQNIRKYIYNNGENKKLCFLRERITDMNYQPGAHNCEPMGFVQYSSCVYYNKHMSYLGLKFFTQKMLSRYERSTEMRKKKMATHYTNNEYVISKNYNTVLEFSHLLENVL